MSWDEVRVGDWVRVKSVESDAEIAGTVTKRNGMWSVSIGSLSLLPARWEAVETRPSYKQGDIGLLKSDGATWVGIYSREDDMFYDTDNEVMRSPLFTVLAGVTIIGNINDE